MLRAVKETEREIDDIAPFKIPAAWDSKMMYEDKNWIYYLTAHDLLEIDKALNEAINKKNGFIESAIDFPLPKLSNLLASILNELEYGYGLFLIRGFTVHKYNYEELRLIYTGIALHVGVLLNQNNKGELIADIMDKGEKWGTLQGRGANTSDPLPFHSDRCDVLSLFCLKTPKHGGESRIVSSVKIHNEIVSKRPDLARILYEPFYHRRALWEKNSEEQFYKLPIFTSHVKHFACRFLRMYIDLAQGIPGVPLLTPEQIEALAFFEELANDSAFYIESSFERGDIQFLNNYVTLHARCPYEDGDNSEQKRHLLRLWLSVPNSRPLNPAFKSLFNDTSAGAVRGGIL